MSTSEIMILIYLGVKGIALQLILTLERPGVSLVHGQTILSSVKDLDFVHFLKSWPGEVALSCDRHICCPLPVFPQPCDFFLVGVVVHYSRKPYGIDIIGCESIQGSLLLQVLVFHSILFPTQGDLELQVDGPLYDIAPNLGRTPTPVNKSQQISRSPHVKVCLTSAADTCFLLGWAPKLRKNK